MFKVYTAFSVASKLLLISSLFDRTVSYNCFHVFWEGLINHLNHVSLYFYIKLQYPRFFWECLIKLECMKTGYKWGKIGKYYLPTFPHLYPVFIQTTVFLLWLIIYPSSLTCTPSSYTLITVFPLFCGSWSVFCGSYIFSGNFASKIFCWACVRHMNKVSPEDIWSVNIIYW